MIAPFPMWAYVAAALGIALGAFGMAQIGAGVGMPFVILASTMWVAVAAARGRRISR